jgi:malic enzyme
MFPGMGLCSVAVRPKRITDSMFQAAAFAMASMVSAADLELGRVVPRVRDIRKVSAVVAAAAASDAVAEGIARRMCVRSRAVLARARPLQLTPPPHTRTLAQATRGESHRASRGVHVSAIL